MCQKLTLCVLNVNPICCRLVKRLDQTYTMASAASLLRKNKRKSLEPRRLAAATWLITEQQSPQVVNRTTVAATGREEEDTCSAAKNATAVSTVKTTARCRLNSTGSEERSPTTTEYTSDSRTPSPTLLTSTTPAALSTTPCAELGKRALPTTASSRHPSCLATKKRFKFDALRDLERSAATTAAFSAPPLHHPAESLSPPTAAAAAAIRGGQQTPPPLLLPAYLPFLLPGLVVGGIDHPQHLLPLHPRLFPFPVAIGSPPEQVEPLALVVADKAHSRRESEEEAPSPVKTRAEAKAKKGSSAAAELTVRRRPAVKAKLKTTLPADTSEAGDGHQQQHEGRQKQLKGRQQQQEGRQQQLEGHQQQLEGQDSPGSPDNDGNRQQHQRNYKNLTRERRVEANARERQRVHTITAAFDTLQAAIPCEDENSKLSKLSVIKIATAYIMALSRMAGYDYTEDQSAPSLDTVVQHCQEVIHTETRIKKRSS